MRAHCKTKDVLPCAVNLTKLWCVLHRSMPFTSRSIPHGIRSHVNHSCWVFPVAHQGLVHHYKSTATNVRSDFITMQPAATILYTL